MRKKLLGLVFDFVYRHPTIFRVFSDIIFGEKMRVWRKMAATEMPKTPNVLEIGCGMYPAIDRGVVLDASLPLLGNIPPGSGYRSVWASATNLPFPDGSFDAVLSVFPTGVVTDGFFRDRAFWQEVLRVLSVGGMYIAAVHVAYRSWFWKILVRIIDPFPKNFWQTTRSLAAGFHIRERRVMDPWGNELIVAEATKQ